MHNAATTPTAGPDVSLDDISATETNSRSRLLSLPAEVRNLIYEYALTAEDGNLYTYNLLGYPGYGPGHYRRSGPYLSLFSRRLKYKPYKEINQLKSVCKQIRTEAKDLELKYNTVVVPFTLYEPYRNRREFKVLPPSLMESLQDRGQPLLWLSSVRFYVDNPYLKVLQRTYHAGPTYHCNLFPLARLCRLIPHTKVHVVIQGWLYEAGVRETDVLTGSIFAALCGLDEMMAALALHPYFESRPIPLRILMEMRDLEIQAKHEFRDLCKGVESPTIFPKMSIARVEQFEATQGVAFVAELPREHPLPRYEDWKKVWCRMAVSWARNGIKPFKDEGVWKP